ncbi:ABC transporter permease [Frigoribacterium sp. CG_9.8]|uniref:ABC transporter permease n=1 Tax=Frigoribacterium sp. CG_9.8 TaxID=2787733 RepID=UPI0018C965C2|nr:ABC transporter permease [Frigoribacterium sp. CG_9.8]MBG6106682.1 lipooligosaccharide transport system permease protein [Frigoribacterium sp. CG_9.8]
MTALVGPAAANFAAPKPRRYGSWYVAEHRIRGIRSYYKTLLFTAIGSPFMYLFALGVGLATLVDKNNGLGGTSYLVFVAPALIVSAAVTAAVQECTYPILTGFTWNPIFLGMNAAPLSGNQITNGIFIAVLARLLPTTLIYYLVMLTFSAVPSPLGVLDIPIAILTGMSFGLVVASYISTVEKDVGQPAFIQRFIVIPLFLFSGTFFPLAQMPIYLQWIGWISPLWHGTQLSRVVSYGAVEPGWLTLVHVLYPLGLCIFGWRRTQIVVTRRLNK